MSRIFLLLLLAYGSLSAQVSYDRLLHAANEPQNWLTYSGGYSSQRYSPLDQITPGNVKTLELKWVFQAESLQKFETTPLVVDGVMYLTQPPNDVVALDAKTGRVFWIYQYSPGARVEALLRRREPRPGDSRRHAVHGHARRPPDRDRREQRQAALEYHSRRLRGRLLDDARAAGREGQGDRRRRRRRVRHPRLHRGVSIARTGKEAWRFYTIPGPGEPGHETWPADDSWQHGGGSVWMTGSYDPELNLTYWGIGNPGPDWNPSQRPGDNLYTDSVVALDADTGKLKWHFQFTPNDAYDYDSVQVPVLADINWEGRPRKADALGESQRLLLRARPRQRRVPLRQAVRQGELGARAGRQRPADGHAATAGHARLSRRPGRHELVFAVVQSRAPACSTSPPGKTMRRSSFARTS